MDLLLIVFKKANNRDKSLPDIRHIKGRGANIATAE